MLDRLLKSMDYLLYAFVIAVITIGLTIFSNIIIK